MTSAHLMIALAALLAGSVFVAKISDRPVRGLYVAIFSCGILMSPYLPIVRDKLAVCEIVIAVTWAAMLLGRRPLRSTSLLPSQRASLQYGIAFLAVVLLSLWVNAVAGNLSLARSGVEAANYIYGFLLFATVIYLVDSWEKWIGCFYAWCGGAAVVCIVAVATMLGHGPAWAANEFTGRISSTLKFSNQLPGYCVPVLALVLVLMAMRDVPRYARFACLVLAGGILMSVVGSGSRMGLLMLFFCIGIVILIGIRARHSYLFSRTTVLAVGAAVVVGFVVAVVSVSGRQEKSYALGATPAYERSARLGAEWIEGKRTLDETRSEQLHLVSEKFAQRPVLGIGPANFTTFFNAHEIHNTYAGVLAEEGLFGLVALFVWLAGVAGNGRLGLKYTIDEKRRLIVSAVLVGFGALLVYGLAMFGLRQRQFWFMCGLVVALPRVIQSRAPHECLTTAAGMMPTPLRLTARPTGGALLGVNARATCPAVERSDSGSLSS